PRRPPRRLRCRRPRPRREASAPSLRPGPKYTPYLSVASRLFPLVAAVLLVGAAGCGHSASAPSRILFMSDRDGEWALYTISANGGGEHRVFRPGRVDPSGEGTGLGEPLVSPDGRKVVLNRRGITVATLVTGASKRIGP